MPKLFKSMIAGDNPSAGAIEVLAPFDQTLIANIETSDALAVDQALNTASQLFHDRSQWLPASRIA